MSVAKPFVFALVCQALGPEEARDRLGANATASLTPGGSQDERWDFLRNGLSRFAGRPLRLDEEVYASASATNHRNRALANLLETYSRLGCDPAEAVDLYTRQSCLQVSATELAVMGATLANGGVNPLTGERVVDAAACQFTLAVMATSGLYETSADWLYDVGVRRARAASAVGSWSCPRARAPWPASPRLSTGSGTASRASWRPGSCPAGWASPCRIRTGDLSRAAGIRTKITRHG